MTRSDHLVPQLSRGARARGLLNCRIHTAARAFDEKSSITTSSRMSSPEVHPMASGTCVSQLLLVLTMTASDASASGAESEPEPGAEAATSTGSDGSGSASELKWTHSAVAATLAAAAADSGTPTLLLLGAEPRPAVAETGAARRLGLPGSPLPFGGDAVVALHLCGYSSTIRCG